MVAASACLVGDGGGAGQVLVAHHGREGILPRFAGGNLVDRAGFGGDAAVFLDVDRGDLHGAGVRDFVGHADLLPFLGSRGRDGPVDGNLRFGLHAGIDDLLGEVLGLVDQFRLSAVRILAVNGILDLEGDLSRLQLLLGNGPLTGPVLAGADGKRGRAEGFDLFSAWIIQRHRTGHISIPDIGHGDGHLDRLRFGKLVGAQLHGDLQRVIRECRGHAQQNQRDPQRQDKEQAFPVHMVSEPGGSFLPSSAGNPADTSVWMDTGYL